MNEIYGEINSLKEYLNSTDYMIVKSYETGYIVPEGVMNERSLARERINELQNKIIEINNLYENQTITNS